MNIVFLSIFICAANIFLSDAVPIGTLGKTIKNVSIGSLANLLVKENESKLLMQVKENESEFLATVSKVDPSELSRILDILRGLLSTSDDRETQLVGALDLAVAALGEANSNVISAEGVLNTADLALTAADLAKTAAQGDKTAAEADLAAKNAVRATKQTEKDVTQSNHDAEIDSLNDEQQMLRDVIDILADLLGKQPQVKHSLYQTGILDDAKVFNEYWKNGAIICRTCESCTATHKSICYKRLTPPAGQAADGWNLFTQNWFNGNNNIHVDFELYNSWEDAKSSTNPWAACNYNDPGIGFPRDCGPNGLVGGQWNSRNRGGHKVEYWTMSR